MTRPGRREAEIDPEEGPLQRFAHELRVLRRQTGSASFQDLARQTRQIGSPFSASTLRNAASGTLLPTGAVVTAFVRACMRHAGQNRGLLPDPAVLDWDTGELVSRWVQRRDELARELTPAPPTVPTPETKTEPETKTNPEPEAVPEPAPKRNHRRALLLAALAAIVVVAVAAVLWNTGPAGTDQATSGTRVDATPVPITSLPPELASGQCRGAHETRLFTYNPCIKSTPAGLEIVVHVTSRKAVPEIAVHVWLHDATAKTRLPDTLHYCQVAFTAADQVSSCGPVTIQPEPGHDYSAAASVEEGTSSWPSLWRDPKTTGLTSPALPWPAEA